MLDNTNTSSSTPPICASSHSAPPRRAGSPPLLFCMTAKAHSDIYPHLAINKSVASDEVPATSFSSVKLLSRKLDPTAEPGHGGDDASMAAGIPKATAAPFSSLSTPPANPSTGATAAKAARMRELVQEEAMTRETLEEEAIARVDGLVAYYSELPKNRPDPHSRATQLRHQHEQRLAERTLLEETREEAHMAADAEEGRQAWLEERQARVAREAARAERAAAAKEAEILHGASRTFLIVEEKKLRAAVEEQEVQDLILLSKARVQSQLEAERAALERFRNSPEQLAIAKKEEKARRRAEAAQKRWDEAQAAFVKNCTHGRGGTSVFKGEAPKKICTRCKVKWDEDAGCYVSTTVGAAAAPSRQGSVKAPPPKPPNGPRARSVERQGANTMKLPLIKKMKPSSASGVRSVAK